MATTEAAALATTSPALQQTAVFLAPAVATPPRSRLAEQAEIPAAQLNLKYHYYLKKTWQYRFSFLQVAQPHSSPGPMATTDAAAFAAPAAAALPRSHLVEQAAIPAALALLQRTASGSEAGVHSPFWGGCLLPQASAAVLTGGGGALGAQQVGAGSLVSGGGAEQGRGGLLQSLQAHVRLDGHSGRDAQTGNVVAQNANAMPH
jgi:hypothetical protein